MKPKWKPHSCTFDTPLQTESIDVMQKYHIKCTKSLQIKLVERNTVKQLNHCTLNKIRITTVLTRKATQHAILFPVTVSGKGVQKYLCLGVVWALGRRGWWINPDQNGMGVLQINQGVPDSQATLQFFLQSTTASSKPCTYHLGCTARHAPLALSQCACQQAAQISRG